MQPWRTQSDLARELAVIVPIYFGTTADEGLMERLLRMTIVDLPAFVRPEQVWLMVDGDGHSGPVARRVLAGLSPSAQGMHLVDNRENQGKLGVLRQGFSAALEAHPQVNWLAALDGDGDHLAAALPTLVRSAAAMAASCGHGRVVMIGARASRERPMGWVRGQMETLLDGLTIDALTYALARQGRALDLAFCRPGVVPDISSGYKVYGRELAALLFADPDPDTGSLSPWDYWHYAPETVPAVEATLLGGVIGEMPRPTWDGQPVSSFGAFGLERMYGELLAWVWTRLQIPLTVAVQHWENHRRSYELDTSQEGAELLAKTRSRALGRLAEALGEDPPGPCRPLLPFL
ncbi:MAG: hypothetical protein ACOX2L_01515 [Anaerolineae bacterium]|jgi:hypothetical protein|nr:hypothetical protein [Chloroflexota bacterium]